MQEKRIPLMAIAVLAFALLLPAVMAGEEVLFADAARPTGEQEAAVTRAKRVDIVWNALNRGLSKTIRLNLFDGQAITAVRDRVDVPAPDSYVWSGHIADSPSSLVTLSVVEDTLMGSIVEGGFAKYTIRYDGTGHILREFDPALQVEVEKEDGLLPPSLPRDNQGNANYCEDGSRVDLLIAYTKAARRKFGGTAAIQALANQRVSEMNTANTNSGLKFRYRLVQVVETDYEETGDARIDLPRLRQQGDGYLDDVTQARSTFRADLTSLLISEARAGTSCGMAYVMNELSTGFADYAYNVAALDYEGRTLSCNWLTLAHELGHNMGNRHDRANSGAAPLLPYAHGYQSPRQTFRTIMAYNCPGGCPRINYWSNPEVSFGGEAVGISHDIESTSSADNVRSMQQTALHVANFSRNCPSDMAPTPTATPHPGVQPTATPPSAPAPYGYKSYVPTLLRK